MIGPDLTEPIISRPQDRVASKQVAFRASGYQLPRTTPPGTSLRATVDMRGKRRFSDADVERARLLHHYRGGLRGSDSTGSKGRL